MRILTPEHESWEMMQMRVGFDTKDRSYGKTKRQKTKIKPDEQVARILHYPPTTKRGLKRAKKIELQFKDETHGLERNEVWWVHNFDLVENMLFIINDRKL